MHALTINGIIEKDSQDRAEHCFYVDMEYVLFPIPYVRTVTFLEEVVISGTGSALPGRVWI